MNFQDWIKQNDTSDESVPSDVGVEINYGIDRRTSVSSNSDGSQSMTDRRRRMALIAGVCAVVILGIGIVVAAMSAVGVFEKESSSTSAEEQQNFDFTGVAPPSVSPTSKMMPFYMTSSPPAGLPSMAPSRIPSYRPSEVPSALPSSFVPTTKEPTEMPSTSPTWYPTVSFVPVASPPIMPLNMTSETLLTFCVIADVPYTKEEAAALPNQIATQMDGCDFLVHLGDLFEGDTSCDIEYYHTIRDMMLQSKVPTFVIPGDNEWNDCANGFVDVGWENWVSNFLRFENYWSHNYTVVRQPGRLENFYFIQKRTLIMGLNIVGGRVDNSTEWSERLQSDFEWTRNVINLNIPTGNADGIIIMSHAEPTADHLHWTVPFRNYVKNELRNQYPILYIHGDGHRFMYTPHFLFQPNILRVQHEGGTRQPVLKIRADPSRYPDSVYSAFQLDRQLELMDR